MRKCESPSFLSAFRVQSLAIVKNIVLDMLIMLLNCIKTKIIYSKVHEHVPELARGRGRGLLEHRDLSLRLPTNIDLRYRIGFMVSIKDGKVRSLCTLMVNHLSNVLISS